MDPLPRHIAHGRTADVHPWAACKLARLHAHAFEGNVPTQDRKLQPRIHQQPYFLVPVVADARRSKNIPEYEKWSIYQAGTAL